MPISSNEILDVLVLITVGQLSGLTDLNRINVKTSAVIGSLKEGSFGRKKQRVFDFSSVD
ncbi:MAG: hypothetical protein EBT92_17445 [Planctomycetes bacterium]|nr:hypothetical protein [Planctomycetota bacterium]